MDRARSTVITVVVLMTTAIAVPAVAGVATAQEQRQQIDACTTIDESGTYELGDGITGVDGEAATNATDGPTDAANATPSLTATARGQTNATVSPATVPACLVVEADDVVLDGNGSVLDGTNASALNLTDVSTGAVPNETNDTVTDTATAVDEAVAANDSGADAASATAIAVRPLPGEGNVTNVTVRDVTVQHWEVGVYLRNATDVALENVTIRDNAVPGVRLDNSSNVSFQSGALVADASG